MAGSSTVARRLLAFLGLVVLAGVALPAAAWVVEAISDRGENWIFPLQLAAVFAVAATVLTVRAEPGRRTRTLGLALASSVAAVLVADAVWLLGLAG